MLLYHFIWSFYPEFINRRIRVYQRERALKQAEDKKKREELDAIKKEMRLVEQKLKRKIER
jgi:hypothetical protein